jgi:hypothetical protein
MRRGGSRCGIKVSDDDVLRRGVIVCDDGLLTERGRLNLDLLSLGHKLVCLHGELLGLACLCRDEKI